MSEEIWKDIPGFEGKYQASTLGRIRSVTREITQISRYGTPFKRVIKLQEKLE
ncbi:NUMOD4 domain-containing protein [Thermincola ferriacetica]